ncbi:DMT family transporter [Nonomuraea harbinensis]|uniref:DMT family transporter n=1 Tax=Nonomuraea harbinensis TaxID=1286938 RepID=A0ABW1BZT2_9ACTN|nr:DMT family transporter [Nonomuraea harbinensis]
MISVVLALLAAASNAAASNLQRQAALSLPQQEQFGPRQVLALVRRPVWLAGIAALIGGFVFQAAALATGPLALVQPVLVTELPFTLVLIPLILGGHVGRRPWLAVAAMTGGLAIFLLSAAPGVGHDRPSTEVWALAATATVGAIFGLCAVAYLFGGRGRPALFGVATGFGFAFTAALIKESTMILESDPGSLVTSWQPYAMVVAGLCSLFLLQLTFRSGPLVVAQPALTISDPVAGILYGTLMFGEDVRTGPWIVLEAAGIGVIFLGTVMLARTPLLKDSPST